MENKLKPCPFCTENSLEQEGEMTTKPKGVMIKGMKMPENCKKCPHIRITGTVLEDIPFCKVTGLVITFSEERAKLNNRPSWCPLQEVK